MLSVKWGPFRLGLNVLTHSDPVMWYYCWSSSSLVQDMACHLFGPKSLSDPMVASRVQDPLEYMSVKTA